MVGELILHQSTRKLFLQSGQSQRTQMHATDQSVSHSTGGKARENERTMQLG